MTDPKHAAQLRAEQLAEQRHHTSYFRLPEHIRLALFTDALRELAEKRVDAADQRRDAERENG